VMLAGMKISVMGAEEGADNELVSQVAHGGELSVRNSELEMS
jgi:hypothetical protein